MVTVIHPEHRERLPGEIGVTYAPGLDYCPDVLALEREGWNCFEGFSGRLGGVHFVQRSTN